MESSVPITLVIECIANCGSWKGSNSANYPLVCLLKRNNKNKGKGWLREDVSASAQKKWRQNDLTDNEIRLFSLLNIILSAVTGLNSTVKKELLFNAFGVTKDQSQMREALQSTALDLFARNLVMAILSSPNKTESNNHDIESNCNGRNHSATPSQEERIESSPNKHSTYETPYVSDTEADNKEDSAVEDDVVTPIHPSTVFVNRNLFNVQPGEDDTCLPLKVLEPSRKRIADKSPLSFHLNRQPLLIGQRAAQQLVGINDNTSFDAQKEIILTPSLSVLDARALVVDIKEDSLLHTAAHRILTALANSRTGVVDLTFIDRQQKKRDAKVFIAPLPRKGKKADDPKSKKANAHRKKPRLHQFLGSICLDEEEREFLLKTYVDDFTNFTLIRKEEEQKMRLEVVEAIALRDYVGLTTNGLLRVARALNVLLQIDCFPKQMQKKIAYLEKTGVDMECLFVECFISKMQMKLCLFIRCTNPALILERMVVSSIIAGKQRKSIDISNYDCSVIVFVGLDRGGGDIYLGMRNGNREGGNQADFCFPLGVLEDASEDHYNNKKTFFLEGSTVNDMYQDLIDDAMHLIQVVVRKNDDNKVLDAQCVTLRLVPAINNNNNHSAQSFNHSKTKVSVRRRGPDIDKATAIRGAVNAENRKRASKVVIPSLRNDIESTQQLELGVQLVKSSAGVLGLRLYDNESVVFGFIFERPVALEIGCTIEIDCQVVRGFPSHDGKCALMISGQSSASSVMPCLRCIEEKGNFKRFRKWMYDHRPDFIPRSDVTNPHIRNGDYSNAACFERFQRITGEGMFTNKKAVSIDDKRAACSVVCQPCATINPEKESGGPMHISSGIVDHLINDTRIALRKIDEQGPLMKELKNLKECVQDYLNNSTDADKLNKMHDAEYAKCLAKANDQLKKLVLNNSADQNGINESLKQTRDYIANVQNARIQHAKASGFGAANLLKKGAAELLQEVTGFLTASSKNCCGTAEYVFNKAIELTGARYRKEHGGMSLSNAHAILVVENYKAISTAVETTYGNHSDLQLQVKEVMRVFERLAEPAYKISLIIKSQAKVNESRLSLLKDATCDYAIAFREVYPGRVPFPKLHWLECITVNFATLHGFLGLGSEEGFESAHNKLSRIKNMLSSMPFTKDRGTKMGQRYQVSLIPGVEETMAKLCPPTKTRQPYMKKSVTEKVNKRLQRLQTGEACEVPPGLVRVPSGNLIYESWRELYDFVAYGAATTEMRSCLEDNTRSLKQNEKFLNLIEYVS